MGKRELLIVAAFVALGAVVYRLSVPSSPETGGGFSLTALHDAWVNRHTPPGRASVTTSGILPAATSLSEIRLANLFTVYVQGEDRDDVAWSLVVETSGPDDGTARGWAESTVLRHDEVGGVLALSVRAPEGAAHSSTLTLQVPARLVMRIESARQTRVDGTAGVWLENLVGDTEIRHVAGAVEGAHRNGALTVEDAGAVALTLVASETIVRGVRGTTTINARNGTTRVEQPAGAVTVEGNGQSLTIVDPQRDVRASGIGGEILVERPRGTVDVDARRTRVTLDLDRAVPATIFTTEAHVMIVVADGTPVALDIASEAGTIDATALALQAETTGGDSRLLHTFGDDARVSVRSQRSSVVIARGK